MEAIEMIQQRRSVRKYSDKMVDRELLKEIIEVARWAPSWANYQIARYTIVDDEQMIEAIHNRGVGGFAYNMSTLRNTKCVVVLSYVEGKSGKLDPSKFATTKGEGWEMFDSGIACQTFCLAAHAKGLGTCIFGVIDDEEIAKIISLPATEHVAAIITCGYEAGDHPKPTMRYPAEDIMRIAGE